MFDDSHIWITRVICKCADLVLWTDVSIGVIAKAICGPAWICVPEGPDFVAGEDVAIDFANLRAGVEGFQRDNSKAVANGLNSEKTECRH